MERLSDTAIEIINELHTERLDYSSEYIPLIDAANRLAAYEETGLEPEQVMELKSLIHGGIHKVDDVWKHVQDLLQAEHDGMLVVLPCKAGSLIYVGRRPAIITRFFGYVRERYFHAVFCDENKGIDIPFEELGKTVFLTSEEAEAALKGGEG